MKNSQWIPHEVVDFISLRQYNTCEHINGSIKIAGNHLPNKYLLK